MRTKDNILNWVTDKIANGNIAAIHVDKIASELHVSKKTIYRYFKNKHQLIDEAYTEFLQIIRNRIMEISKKDTPVTARIIESQIVTFDGLKNLFPIKWQSFDSDYKTNNDINPMRLFFYSFLFNTFKSLLIEGIVNKELIHQIELDIVTKKILFDLYGILEFGQKEVKEKGKDKIFHFNTGLLLKGLENQKIEIM